MSDWDTTTPTSSHVGQPGYDTQEVWERFCRKYRDRVLQFGYKHFPAYRDMIEDVFQSMAQKIALNPFALAYEPLETHFHSVLVALYCQTFFKAIRELKLGPKKRYLEKTAAFREECTTQDCTLKELQTRVLKMFCDCLRSPDYPNGRFAPEIDSLDREIWLALQEDGATLMKVARAKNLSLKRVFMGNRRVKQRIIKDVRGLLAAQGLL